MEASTLYEDAKETKDDSQQVVIGAKRAFPDDSTPKPRKVGKKTSPSFQQLSHGAESKEEVKVHPEEADDSEIANVQRALELDRVVDDAQHLFVQFSPDRIVESLESSQHFVVSAKRALPNLSLCRHPWLADLVRKVQQECDDLSWCVSDFVVQTDFARSKMELLHMDVISLLAAGQKALSKVKKDNEPWNYGEIAQQVINLEERYRLVVSQIDDKFEEVKKRLDRNRGDSINELCLNIRGSKSLQGALDHQQKERRDRITEARKQVAYHIAEVDFIKSEQALLEAQQISLTERECDLLNQLGDVHNEIRKLTSTTEKNVEKVLKEFTTKQEDVDKMVSSVQSDSDIAAYRRLSKNINDHMVRAASAKEQVDEVERASDAQVQPQTNVRPPSTHFVLVVDESASMQRNSCKNLKAAQRAISTLSTARIKCATRDQVSLVVYDNRKMTLVFNKEWRDVQKYCNDKQPHFVPDFRSGLTRPGHESNFSTAFAAINDLMSKVCPKQGMHMNTVLLLFTDGSCGFMDDNMELAKASYSLGCRHGNFKGFLVSSSDSGENELKANPFLEALNFGLQGFTDVEDKHQSFFTNPTELIRKMRAVDDLAGDASALARLRFQRHNERHEELQVLYHRKQKDMAAKQQAAKRYAETRLTELEKQKNVSVAQTRQHLSHVLSFQTERASEIQMELSRIRAAEKDVRQHGRSAAENLAVNVGKSHDYKKELQSIEALFTEVYDERARADRQKMDDMLGNFDAEQLLEVLEVGPSILQQARENLYRAMHTFTAATNPIQNLILVLKMSADVKLHPNSKAGKVLQAYRRHGVALLSSMPEHEQFSRIIQHICKDENMNSIKTVAKFVTVSDFITAVERKDALILKGESDTEAVDELRNILYDGLLQKDDGLASEKADLVTLQDEHKQIKKVLAELSRAPEDEDGDERAQRKEDMEVPKSELRELTANIAKAKRNMEKSIRDSFGPELIILHMVLKDITSIYHSILLEHGMVDAEMQLRHIYQFCSTSLTEFRKQAEDMALTYSRRPALKTSQNSLSLK